MKRISLYSPRTTRIIKNILKDPEVLRVSSPVLNELFERKKEERKKIQIHKYNTKI